MPTFSGTQQGRKTRPLYTHTHTHTYIYIYIYIYIYVFGLYPTIELIKLKINLYLSPRHNIGTQSSTHSGSQSLVSGPHNINKKLSLYPAGLITHTKSEQVGAMNSEKACVMTSFRREVGENCALLAE